MKLAAVVVIYNRKLSESETLCSLKGISGIDIDIIVYDNSDSDYEISKDCADNKWIYVGGTGNVGLAKAYNTCIELVAQEYDRLCFFDDDTSVSPHYFSAVRDCAEKTNVDIMLPILKADGNIISPYIMGKHQKVRFFTTNQECLAYQGKGMSGFNSGMSVACTALKLLRFNEDLFMDAVDMDFISRAEKENLKISALPVEMEHSFSGLQRPSYEKAKERFVRLAKDYAIYLINDRTGYRNVVGKRALHLCFIYKKYDFIKIYKSNIPK